MPVDEDLNREEVPTAVRDVLHRDVRESHRIYRGVVAHRLLGPPGPAAAGG